MLGGHIVKTGLAPVLSTSCGAASITHLAMNGSAAIHDYEIARFGGTSEDVAGGLRDGTFGMAEETGRGMNEAFIRGMKGGWGMGEALARALDEEKALAHPELSILLNALAARRSRHGPRGARRGDHPSAPRGERRRDRRHEPPRFPPARRVARRDATTAASCSTWAAR